MTLARAIADERQAIVRHIDEMRGNLASRTTPGFVLLNQLKLWLLARGEEKKEGVK